MEVEFPMRRIILFAFVLILLSNPAYGKNKGSIVSRKIRQVSSKIVASFKARLVKKEKIKIAIIELENLSDRARKNNIGRIVSEMLTTNLAQVKVFNVIERQQLSKVLEELKLNQTGVVDSMSAKRLGKLLAADAILCGSVSEVGKFFDINIRLIDVEKATILTAAVVEIKQADFLVNMGGIIKTTNIRQKIQNGLDSLDTAIRHYSGVKTRYKVVWPKKLSDLVPEYLDRIPDPVKGYWVYEPKTGKVHNSAYPEINPTIVHPKLKPLLDRAKKAVIMAGVRSIRTALMMYFAEKGRYPRKLSSLVPNYLSRLPNAMDGSWEYDSRTGKVWHSKYKLDNR